MKRLLKTLAAILVEQKASLVVDEVSMPELAFGQVLVRLKASGICGKQLNEYLGTRGEDLYLPHLLGHEGAGVVKAIGAGVGRVSVGDHVVASWMKGSGINARTPLYEWQGRKINAGNITTFQEWSIISENRLTPLPKSIPFDMAALLGCAIPTGFGIVFNQAQIYPGSKVAVFGAGGVGLSVTMGAALASASKIIVVDVRREKLQLAREFGATHIINAKETDPVVTIRDLTAGVGVDYSIATTGNPGAMEQAYESARMDSGMAILAGVPDGKITIDMYPMNFGRKLTGSHGGATVIDRDIPRYVELYQGGRLNPPNLITNRFKLQQINQAIGMLHKGEILGRAILEL